MTLKTLYGIITFGIDGIIVMTTVKYSIQNSQSFLLISLRS